MPKEIRIGKRILGGSHPCFITFEAGPTHCGLDSAIELINKAAEAGADAIKFQVVDADRLVAKRDQTFSYSILTDKALGTTEEVSEPLYDILKRRQLATEEWRIIKAQADKLGIEFFATACFEEDIAFMVELGCSSIKIASADIDNAALLRSAARSGMAVQIDTGSADIGEIDRAVRILQREGSESVVIHQCPSGYPARIPSINLRMIESLNILFPDCIIAYSDHTPDADMDIAAVALGVGLIEKTITLDRCTPSVEHLFSIEPAEYKRFISRIRDVETALGASNRQISQEQNQNRKAVRRSPYLKYDARKGSRIEDLQIEFKRPQATLSPVEWESYAEANSKLVLNQALPAGTPISYNHFQ
jgi:N,N'-diacetyllegionaminate synthase